MELRAIRHVINFRVAGHGVCPRVAQCGIVPGISFYDPGQCSAATNIILTPRAMKETDVSMGSLEPTEATAPSHL